MPTNQEQNKIINQVVKAGNDVLEKQRQIDEFRKKTGISKAEFSKQARGGQQARIKQIKAAAIRAAKLSNRLDDSFVPEFTRPGKQTHGIKFPKKFFGKVITGKSVKRFAKMIVGMASKGLPALNLQVPKVDPVGLRERSAKEKSKL